MSGWILDAASALDAADAGGKARALARAQGAGLPVPPWFALSSSAFRPDLSPEERDAIRDAVRAAVQRICPNGELVAVRSSAADEDGAEHSFAGQLESFLNVAHEDVDDRVRAVWQSAFTDRILQYRRERGLEPMPRPPAVLIQRMVSPRVAGVAFGADPVSGRTGIAVVSAAPGFGSGVVSGEADTDTWLVDRADTVVERRIVPKSRMHVADPSAPGGVRSIETPPELAREPALSDAQVIAVARLARAAGRCFGRPQDIEWAIADDLVLLQSRPITSMRAMADPDARAVIWDNSNIVESYSGVTTPLTFSFAREIYEHVYRQFCRMMAVPASTIAAQDETFANMLGLVRGRLYYNLLNWYRVLAMLPGYRINRRFMEQMMGVREPLPEVAAADLAREVTRGRVRDALYAGRTVVTLVAHHLLLNRRVDAFYARLDRALAPPHPPLEDRRFDELVAHYRDLRRQLLLRWDAPLVNDFFAMIFYGSLRSLVIRWAGDPGGTLQNDLIGGQGGIVSAEPAVRMQRLARLAASRPALLDALTQGSVEEVLAAARRESASEFLDEYEQYLQKFGDRTINELKLESVTLHDDSLPLLRAIAALGRQYAGAGPQPGTTAADRLRAESLSRVNAALAGHPLRRAIFSWVLRHARRRVRDRENLRLERTRLFGRVRRIFLECGRRLHAWGLLDDPRDVFYLEVDEVLAFADGRSTSADLGALATLRKREFERYREQPAPPDRFETHGPVYYGQDFQVVSEPAAATGDERTGLGCSPGIVRGVVRVISDPTGVTLEQRAILVAEHTDPGWIMIFPAASGVLVERGSLLSHAAIVARELGIPAVVSLPGITRWLRDGDWVEMDGTTGRVRRIAPPGEGDA